MRREALPCEAARLSDDSHGRERHRCLASPRPEKSRRVTPYTARTPPETEPSHGGKPSLQANIQMGADEPMAADHCWGLLGIRDAVCLREAPRQPFFGHNEKATLVRSDNTNPLSRHEDAPFARLLPGNASQSRPSLPRVNRTAAPLRLSGGHREAGPRAGPSNFPQSDAGPSPRAPQCPASPDGRRSPRCPSGLRNACGWWPRNRCRCRTGNAMRRHLVPAPIRTNALPACVRVFWIRYR